MLGMIRSPAQKELSFLQTLIDEEFEQQQQIPDSDKENEEWLRVNNVEKSDVVLHEQAKEMKMELIKDKNRQGISVNINHIKSREKDNIWGDFLTDDELQGKNGKVEERKDQLDDNIFESLEKLKREEEKAVSVIHVVQSDGCVDKKNSLRDEIHAIKKKTHAAKEVKHSLAPTSTGGPRPDLICHNNDKSNLDIHLETMSETNEKHERRLGRRKQVTRPKCAGPAPSGDVLQQKIQELHALMVKPLTEPRQYMHQTRQELLHLLGVSQQHAAEIMEKQSLPGGFRRGIQQPVSAELTSDNSDDGYSALRAAQISGAKQRRPWTAMQINRKPLLGKDCQRRPFSAQHRQDKNLQAGSRRHSPDNISTDLQGRGWGDKKGRKESCDRSNNQNVRIREQLEKLSQSQNDNKEGKSSGGSPERVVQHSDTHLKHSNNPALKKWLRKKNKEFRRQKIEERKRLKEERAKKEAASRAKEELFKDSDKKVKEWEAQKRKEARKTAKEKRKIMREEEKMRHRRNQRQIFGEVRIKSLELSSRTQTSHDKFIPVIRPETVQGETNNGKEQNGQSDVPCTETESPHPPASKFVYRRPVSGRVRFMKLQQKHKDDANSKSEQEKILMETKLAQDKAKKMRVSYDQWLLKKREEDYVKRQEIAKQKALTKSDPELERILPEIARRRIESIQRGKKRIDTGMNIINDEVNKSFGGSDFHTEPERETKSDQIINELKVSGQQETLTLRPSTAKQPFSPKESRSPRRATSASSHIQAHKDDEDKNRSSQPNPFRLPFPPQEGAPKYVISKQKKLFSSHVTQDKTSTKMSDQVREDTLKISDPLVQTSQTAKETKTGYENMNIPVASADLVGESAKDVKCDSAVEGRSESPEEERSFFVTHGNLGDINQGQADYFQEIEDTIVEDIDESEKLQDEIELDNQESAAEQAEIFDNQENAAEQADILDNQESATEQADILDNQESATEQADILDNQESAAEQADILDNQESATEQADILDNQESATEQAEILDNHERCEKVTDSHHHVKNAKDKIGEDDVTYDRVSDDLEQSNVSDDRITDYTDGDDIEEGNVEHDRIIDYSDDIEEENVTEKIVRDDSKDMENHNVTNSRISNDSDVIEESDVEERIQEEDKYTEESIVEDNGIRFDTKESDVTQDRKINVGDNNE